MIKYILPLFLTCLMLLSGGTVNDLFAQKRSKEPAPLTEQQINKRKETFMNAAKARVLEDWSKAEELFNEVLNIDPKHDASMYELAKLYRRHERLDDAILLMEKAISISDGNEWYYLLLGDLYKLTFQLEKLIQTQEKLIAAFPGKIDYRLDLAVSYIITEDFKRAIAVYDDIESTIGKTEDVSLQKQKLYLDLNQPRKALNEIESLVEAYPGNVRYLQILAETYLDAGQDKKALETYQQIAELDPDNAFIHISLADLYRRQGNEQKSFEELKRGFAKPELELDVKIQVLLSFYSFEEFYDTKKEPVLELATILAETHPNESRALSLYGEMLYRNRQLEQALEVINRVLEIDLSRYSVWEQKLLIENEILNSDSLLKTSARAMELFPMQPLPYLFKGFAHYQLKDWNAAKSALKSGASLVVDNDFLETQFYSTLGDVHNKLKEHKKSDEYYEKALTLNPEDAYVLNNYGYYLSQRGENLERAKEMAEKANQLMPDTPSFQDTYGWILYKTGDYTEAEKWIRMAIDNDEEGSAVLFEHYGDVLYKLGKKEDALYYWKKASEKNGDTSELLNEKIRTGTLHE